MRRLVPTLEAKEREEKGPPPAAVAGDEEEGGEDEAAVLPAGDKRAQRKAEKKAQREAHRHFLQQREEVKRRKEAARAEASQRREEEAEEAEEARAEEERRRALERKEREEAELTRWKGEFTVEGEGEVTSPPSPTSSASAHSTASALLQWIRAQKVVEVDEVALRLGVRTREAAERMREWEREGQLRGVWDDRGRWVEVTEEEMSRVREWVVQQGRIHIGDLVTACNRLIEVRDKGGAQEAGGREQVSEGG